MGCFDFCLPQGHGPEGPRQLIYTNIIIVLSYCNIKEFSAGCVHSHGKTQPPDGPGLSRDCMSFVIIVFFVIITVSIVILLLLL